MAKPTSCTSLTVAANGVHRFKVDGYSITKQLAGVGEYYQSEKFSVGGHDWAVRYYPTTLGCRYYLVMLSRPKGGGVGVVFACAPLGQKSGEPSAREEQRLSLVFATGGGQEANWPIIFSKEVLESAEFLVGDCFAVQFTVSVLKKPLS